VSQRISINDLTFKTLEVKIDVTPLYKVIDDFIAKSKSMNCLEIISEILSILKIPTEKDLEDYVRGLDDLVFRKLVTRIIVDEENNPIYRVLPENIDSFDKMRQTFLYIKTHSILINYIFDKLYNNGVDIYSCIVETLNKIPFFSKHVPFIDISITEHKQDHLVGSITILGLRIEDIIRDLLKNQGVDTLKTLPKGTVEEKSLGTLFYNEPKLKDILGDDLYNYLLVLLIRKEGENIRNILAHSLMSFEEYRKELSSLLIFVILLLMDKVMKIIYI